MDLVKERLALSQAIMDAASALAQGHEPEAMLRIACEGLVRSTPHVRVVWMLMGNLECEVLQPQFAVGPAKAYAADLAIRNHADASDGPILRAIAGWKPVVEPLTETSQPDDPARPAQPFGLKSVLCLPVGRRHSASRGIITIYADTKQYFSVSGLAVFEALSNVITTALEQGELLRDLSHRATHDQLTGVLNRRGLEQQMEAELSRSTRHRMPFGLLLLDIDRFKLINDSLGHKEGDVVLQEIARRVKTMLRMEDQVGRWGGEEFLCLFPETQPAEVRIIAERLRLKVAETAIETKGGPVTVTASFGFSCFPDDGAEPNKLVAAADGALYQAKASGRNRTLGAMDLRQNVYSVGSMLHAALGEGRILPAFQPIVELSTGKVVAEEALARLITADNEVLEANQFIEAASQLQLLHRLDRAILLKVIEHCASRLRAGTNNLSHFVNISADLLRHGDLVAEILSAEHGGLAACGGLSGVVKPMVIEITEQELVTNIRAARELLMPFIDFGLQLALDDFGSGYSGYRYLADLPLSFLKIDGQLCRRLNEPKVRAIVQGIQNTADQLGITTLAECVEDPATEAILKDIGVDWAQGYLYGRPKLAGVSRRSTGRQSPTPARM
jgi:diguanylate cyclase (GGDEF)-like protein